MTTHYVYEFYAADDTPLYVGCTSHLGRRFSTHALKAWWPDVAHVQVAAYADRDAGWAAEAECISSLQPIHNLIHTARESEVIQKIEDGRNANREKRHSLGLNCYRRASCPVCAVPSTTQYGKPAVACACGKFVSLRVDGTIRSHRQLDGATRCSHSGSIYRAKSTVA